MNSLRWPFKRRLNLSVRVGLLAGVFAFFIALLISTLVGFQTADYIKRGQGQVLSELAHQTTIKIDQALNERRLTVRLAASANALRDEKAPLAIKQKLIDRFRSTYPEYNWLGIADAKGNVIAASDQRFLGQNVSEQEWFKKGLVDAHLGEARIDARSANPADNTRFIDISSPVVTDDGKTIGVLCGLLSWDWIEKLSLQVTDELHESQNVEMFILQKNGEVLVSPGALAHEAAAFLEDSEKTKLAESIHEVFIKKKGYLYGLASTRSSFLPSAREWIVVIRQATDVALKPATQLRLRILVLGGCIGLFFGLIAAYFVNGFIRPFADLGEAAKKFKEGKDPDWPTFYSNDEAADLSMALKDMIASIEVQKTQLLRFNENLQTKVEERTQALVVANQKLLSSESQVRSIMQTAPDAIIAMNHGLRIISWNQGASSAFGYSEQEASGQMISFLIPDRFQKQYLDAVHRAAEFSEVQRLEIMGLRQDGSEFDLEMSLTCFRSGGTVFFTAIIRDITERKKIENALITARVDAESAAAAKAQFLAQMSHEIRTPLNGMIGMSTLLLDTHLNDSQRDQVNTVIDCAEGLLGIINDVLDFSKVDAGKMDLESLPFNPVTMVSDTEKALALSAANKKIELKTEWMTNPPAAFIGDPGRIRQILLNLINNAIKFTSVGSVTIRMSHVEKANNQAMLHAEIIDTGIGIPEDALSRMFQAFSQADSSMSRKYGGTGLGLSICKKIVELMNGEIGVISAKGKGSTFWFKVPLQISKEKLAEKPVEQEEITASFPARILVAEDNPVNLQISLMMLKKAGYKPQGVGNGNEVLDALRSTPYDLILMDCQMPELDGYEATKIIRSSDSLNCKDIPVIAMTANVIKGAQEECFAAGMDDYVSKPVKLEALVQVIEKHLRSSNRSNSKFGVA